MEFNYNKVLIYGYGVSGKSVEKVLKQMDVEYKIYDDNIRIGGGHYVLSLNARTLKKFDLVVLSPGVSIFNKYVRKALKLGIKVISELEFGYLITNIPIIAVTGTNGKTSTVTLIKDMLTSAGYKTGAFGNVGTPLTCAYGQNLDYIVCEVSSFQLECIDKFTCHIGVILNIDKDHIDRHKTIKNYINCKLAIAKNSGESDYIILNDDDKVCSVHKDNFLCKVLLTSSNRVVEGVYAKDGAIYFNNGVGISELFNLHKIKMLSQYLDNIMASIAVAKCLDISTDIIIKSIKNWHIPPHRLEFVTKSRGVKYIDDSKSTNVHSVQKAIASVNGNIILLLGGANKKLDFVPLISTMPKNVKYVVTFGASSKYIARLCRKYDIAAMQCTTMESAVKQANLVAVSGDTILLSPGCTSFDAYSSYAKRGEHFKEIVRDICGYEK